jgi:hypothetical protein
VLFGWARGQVAAVAGALGFNGPGSADCLDDLAGWIDGLMDWWIDGGNHLTPALSPCGEGGPAGDGAGDVRGQYSIGASAAVTGRDGGKQARGGDKRGHLASAVSKSRAVTARVFPSANIKDTSVLKMIENSMNNGALGPLGGSEDRCFRVLCNYWGAVSQQFQSAWVLAPRQSRLTHGVGIIGMGYLMDTIAHGLSERWDVSPLHAFLAEVRRLGNDLPWVGGCWDFEGGMRLPWNEVQNNTRHVEVVANYLIRRYRRAQASIEAGDLGSGEHGLASG